MSAKKNKISSQSSKPAEMPVDPAALAQVAGLTRNLLAFHPELGLADYPATSGLRQLFKQKQAASDRSALQAHLGKTDNKSNRAASLTLELEAINGELVDCQGCGPEKGPITLWPGQGSVVPRLFVVGDYFAGIDGQKGMIWGAEEDELFWKMMAAIGLDQQSVYVSNCIKCSQEDGSQPDFEVARRCFTFLERELAAIQPGLICTMGELATRQLLSSRQPLVRMRGSFHPYRYPHGGLARVMPTFHPRFLLQHPEMKRASWLDLQAVQRQLLEDSQK